MARTSPNRFARATATFASNQLREVVGQSLRLVSWPFVVSTLGPSIYGAYVLVSQVTQFVSAGDMRLGNVLGLYIARLQHSGDVAAKRRMVGAHVRLCWYLFGAFLLLGVGLAAFAPRVFNVPQESVFSFQVALVLSIVLLAVRPLVNAPQVCLTAHNLGYRGTPAMLVSDVAVPLLSIVVVLLGGRLVALTALQWVGFGLVALPLLHIARKELPWFGVEQPRPEEFKKALGTGMHVQVDALAMVFTFSSPGVFIGYFHNLESVAAYAIANRLFDVVRMFAMRIGSATAPVFGGTMGAGDVEGGRRMYRDLRAVILGVVSWGTVVLFAVNQPMLRLLLKSAAPTDTLLQAGLALVLYTYGAIIPAAFLLPQLLLVKEKNRWSVVYTVVNLGFCLLLVPRFGATGMAWAIALAQLVLLWGYNRELHVALGLHLLELFALLLRCTAASALLGWLGWWGAQALAPQGWLPVIGYAAVCAAFSGVVLGLVVFTGAQRMSLVTRIRSVMERHFFCAKSE